LQEAFAALDSQIPLDLIRMWFSAQLLRLSGHTPNLQTQRDGTKLTSDARYEFSFDDSAFMLSPDGPYISDHIKFLRLLFAGNTPQVLAKVSDSPELTSSSTQLVRLLAQQYIR
jgi:hypothetical protein